MFETFLLWILHVVTVEYGNAYAVWNGLQLITIILKIAWDNYSLEFPNYHKTNSQLACFHVSTCPRKMSNLS